MRMVVSMSFGADAATTERDPDLRKASIMLERYIDSWFATGEVLLFAASGDWGWLYNGHPEYPALFTSVSSRPVLWPDTRAAA